MHPAKPTPISASQPTIYPLINTVASNVLPKPIPQTHHSNPKVLWHRDLKPIPQTRRYSNTNPPNLKVFRRYIGNIYIYIYINIYLSLFIDLFVYIIYVHNVICNSVCEGIWQLVNILVTEFSIVLELSLLQYLCEFGWFNNNYCADFVEMMNGSTLSCIARCFLENIFFLLTHLIEWYVK